MEWIAYLLLAFAALRLGVAGYNFLSRPYLPRTGRSAGKVSVLIPARNEQENIHRLLSDLREVRYSPMEILVYDDDSTDGTAGVVRGCMEQDARVVLLRGKEPGKGWLGKNYACDRLSQAAGGRWLLFIDADVRIRPRTVAKAVRYMQTRGLSLLSLFPTQRIPSLGSRLSVPLMNWILLGSLPLALVRLSSRPSLSAANGQFMLFDAETYRRIRPHRLFRNSRAEDIAIGKHYKKLKFPTATLLGGEDVECRMYGSLPEAVRGFSRNIFQFFGGSTWVGLLFAAVTTAGPFLAFACGGVRLGILYLAMIVLIRWFVSLASRQSFAGNLLLMPLQQIVLWAIMIRAVVSGKKRNLLWKERNIYDDCSCS